MNIMDHMTRELRTARPGNPRNLRLRCRYANGAAQGNVAIRPPETFCEVMVEFAGSIQGLPAKWTKLVDNASKNRSAATQSVLVSS